MYVVRGHFLGDSSELSSFSPTKSAHSAWRYAKSINRSSFKGSASFPRPFQFVISPTTTSSVAMRSRFPRSWGLSSSYPTQRNLGVFICHFSLQTALILSSHDWCSKKHACVSNSSFFLLLFLVFFSLAILLPTLEKELRCILDFEGSRNQRKGSEFFLGKWNSWGGFPLPSSAMAFWKGHMEESNWQPLCC